MTGADQGGGGRCQGLTREGAQCSQIAAVGSETCSRRHRFKIGQRPVPVTPPGYHDLMGSGDQQVAEMGEGEAVAGLLPNGKADVLGVNAVRATAFSGNIDEGEAASRADRLADLVGKSAASGTVAAKQGAVAGFIEHCQSYTPRRRPLPADANTILEWVADLSEHINPRTGKQLTPETLRGKVRAVRDWHTAQGHPDPLTDAGLDALLTKLVRGFKTEAGRPKVQATPMMADDLAQVIARLRRPSAVQARDLLLALAMTQPAGPIGARPLARAVSREQIDWSDPDEPARIVTVLPSGLIETLELHPHPSGDHALDPRVYLSELLEQTDPRAPLFANRSGRPMSNQGITDAVARLLADAGVDWETGAALDDAAALAAVVEHGTRPTDEQVMAHFLHLHGWMTGERVSEVAAVRWYDVWPLDSTAAWNTPDLAAQDFDVALGRTKSDPDGNGRHTIVKAQGNPWFDYGTVRREWWGRWVDRFGRVPQEDDPLFVNLHAPAPTALSKKSIGEIFKRTVLAGGLTGRKLSSHGWRAGLITEAALAGKAIEDVAAHVGHAAISTTGIYYRVTARLGDGNPTAGLFDVSRDMSRGDAVIRT